MGQHDVSARGLLVTQADRFHWQRAAVRELAAILDAHSGLPAISWTIGPGGALSGRVNGLTGSADEVPATFGAWRGALGLNEGAGQFIGDGNSVVHLRTSGRRGSVSVRITASVFVDDPARYADAAVTSRQRRTVRPWAGPLPPSKLAQGPEPRQIP